MSSEPELTGGGSSSKSHYPLRQSASTTNRARKITPTTPTKSGFLTNTATFSFRGPVIESSSGSEGGDGERGNGSGDESPSPDDRDGGGAKEASEGILGPGTPTPTRKPNYPSPSTSSLDTTLNMTMPGTFPVAGATPAVIPSDDDDDDRDDEDYHTEDPHAHRPLPHIPSPSLPQPHHFGPSEGSQQSSGRIPAFRLLGHPEFSEPSSPPMPQWPDHVSHPFGPRPPLPRPLHAAQNPDPDRLSAGDVGSGSGPGSRTSTTTDGTADLDRMWAESEDLYRVIQGQLNLNDSGSDDGQQQQHNESSDSNGAAAASEGRVGIPIPASATGGSSTGSSFHVEEPSPAPGFPQPQGAGGHNSGSGGFALGKPDSDFESLFYTRSPPSFPQASGASPLSGGRKPFQYGSAGKLSVSSSRPPSRENPSTETFVTVPSEARDSIHYLSAWDSHQEEEDEESQHEDGSEGHTQKLPPIPAPSMPLSSTTGGRAHSIPTPQPAQHPFPQGPQSTSSKPQPHQAFTLPQPQPQHHRPNPPEPTPELQTQAMPPPVKPPTIGGSSSSPSAKPNAPPSQVGFGMSGKPQPQAFNAPRPHHRLDIPEPRPQAQAAFPTAVNVPSKPGSVNVGASPATAHSNTSSSGQVPPSHTPFTPYNSHSKPPTSHPSASQQGQPSSSLGAPTRPNGNGAAQPTKVDGGTTKPETPAKPSGPNLNANPHSTNSNVSSNSNAISKPPSKPSGSGTQTHSEKPSKPTNVDSEHRPFSGAHDQQHQEQQGKHIGTRYVSMLLALDDIPNYWNLLASFFTWILLAGFLLFPGTFTSWQQEQAAANSTGSPAVTDQFKKAVLGVVSHVPLFVIAFLCSGVGAAGMGWLWWRWRANYVWLLSKVFVPGLLNALAGLLSTLANIFGAQSGQFSTSAKVTTVVTGSACVVTGVLVLFYQFWLLRRVQNEHFRQIGGKVAKGRHGEGVLKGMMESKKKVTGA